MFGGDSEECNVVFYLFVNLETNFFNALMDSQELTSRFNNLSRR